MCAVFLGQPNGFADSLSQIIQLCALGFAASKRSDVKDIRTVQREGPLHTFIVDDSADGEHLVYPPALSGNDSAGENLYPLLIAFHNPAMHIDRIAYFEMRDFFLQALALDRI